MVVAPVDLFSLVNIFLGYGLTHPRNLELLDDAQSHSKRALVFTEIRGPFRIADDVELAHDELRPTRGIFSPVISGKKIRGSLPNLLHRQLGAETATV